MDCALSVQKRPLCWPTTSQTEGDQSHIAVSVHIKRLHRNIGWVTEHCCFIDDSRNGGLMCESVNEAGLFCLSYYRLASSQRQQRLIHFNPPHIQPVYSHKWHEQQQRRISPGLEMHLRKLRKSYSQGELDKAGNWHADWGSVWSDANTAQVYCGKEVAGLKGIAVKLPLDLQCDPRL